MFRRKHLALPLLARRYSATARSPGVGIGFRKGNLLAVPAFHLGEWPTASIAALQTTPPRFPRPSKEVNVF